MTANVQTPQKRAGNRGLGRPKGAKNKLQRDVRAMVQAALNNAGGVEYLTRQAEENPRAFLALVAKLLPTKVEGDEDKPVRMIHSIRRVIIDPRGPSREEEYDEVPIGPPG